AGVEDQQAFVPGLGGHDLVARRLVLTHLLRVARIVGVVVWLGTHAALSCWVCGNSFLIRSAALFERGVHRPRRIASWNRATVSRSAAGFFSDMKARTSSLSM